MVVAWVVTTVVITLSGVYSVLRIRHWRDMYWSTFGVYEETLNRALDAETSATDVRKELEFLQNVVLQVAARKSVAVLTEDQVNLICNSIASIVLSTIHDPNRLN